MEPERGEGGTILLVEEIGIFFRFKSMLTSMLTVPLSLTGFDKRGQLVHLGVLLWQINYACLLFS